MISSFSKWLDRLINVLTILSGVFLFILVFIVCSEITLRFLFNLPIVYTTELTELFFPWMIFLGAVAVTHKSKHIRIDFFNKKLPAKIRFLNGIFIKCVMLFFSILVCISSVEFSNRFSNQLMPVLRISMFWLYSSMSVSFAIISIIVFFKMVVKIFGFENKIQSR